MSRKLFSNRLDSLFSEPESINSYSGSHPDQSLPGWTWECDSSGKIIACSPEVEEVLGFRLDDIIGQPLASFALPPDSSSVLLSVLKRNQFPAELDLQYRSRDGAPIPVSLHIFDISDGENKRLGGFAQALFIPGGKSAPAQNNPPAEGPLSGATSWKENRLQPFKMGRDVKADVEEVDKQNGQHRIEREDVAKAPPVVPKVTKQARAGEKIKQILENIRQNNPEIKNSEFSQVIANQKEQLKEDRSKRPTVTGSLAGIEIHSYPKIVVHEFEYRLEWGSKLDLDTDEAAFIKSQKYKATGLSGLLKRRSAPKEIVKHDIFWIAVSIVEENGKPKELLVSYDKKRTGTDSIEFERFLLNPEILTSKLAEALKAPWHSRTVLRIGEDYLILR